MRNVAPLSERRAGAQAFALLSAVAAGRELSGADPRIEAALEILHREWADPSMGVDALALRLKWHRSSLSRRFRAVVGVSPRTYLINLRLQNALGRLRATSKPSLQIAQDCGWTDPTYFSRCIRRATGSSPRVFRKH